jgi:hypothetical protein
VVHFSTQNYHTPLSLASLEESSSPQIPQLPTETETQIQKTKNPNSKNPEPTRQHKSYITTTTTKKKIVFKNCDFAIQFLHHNKNQKKNTQQHCEEKGRLRTQNQNKKALSRCHEILRQQRAPGDGWSDARKEKENATRAPTHIPMHDNVDVWASSGTVM